MTVTASATDYRAFAGTRSGHYRKQYGGRPLRVAPVFDLILEPSKTGWIVVDRYTGIHGFGPDPLGAIQDFRHAALEHLDVLESQLALSPELTEQLAYLRSRLRADI